VWLLLASCSGMKWPCSCPNAPSAGPVHCPAPATLPATGAAVRGVQGTYCGGWRRCACLDAKTRVLAVGGLLVSTTYNNLTADLLLTRRVPCAWPAPPARAGWYCHLGVLPL
jgi:hypothetical protein